jgi:outer membrane protein assembly factor BamA
LFAENYEFISIVTFLLPRGKRPLNQCIFEFIFVKNRLLYFFVIGLVWVRLPLFSQDSIHKTTIRKIIIQGNKKTKDYVIRRELTLKEGQSIDANKLDSLVLANRLQVFNLMIFNEVNFNILNWTEDSLDLVIKVYEKWTIIPFPVIKFADRNINEWWKLHNHDFKRLQYGLTVNWANFTGRNDLFRVSASFGFAEVFEGAYLIPQVNKKGTIGIASTLSLMRSKHVAYNTIDDILQYLELGKSYQYTNIKFDPSFFYRPRIHVTHFFEAGYGYTKVSDSVITANPKYFTNSKNTQHYFSIGYIFEADYRNIVAYPTEGWLIRMGISNYGLGFMKDVKMTDLFFRFSKYNTWQNHPKWSLANYGKLELSFRDKQPYNLQLTKSLGYKENLVRGYELYVVDGQHSLLFKTEQRFRLVDFRLKNVKKLQGKGIMEKSLAYLPINVMLKTFFDAAYVWDNQFEQNNTLKNKWIFGFGVGMDIITFGNQVFRIEYSVNRKLENRVYLHFEQSL